MMDNQQNNNQINNFSWLYKEDSQKLGFMENSCLMEDLVGGFNLNGDEFWLE